MECDKVVEFATCYNQCLEIFLSDSTSFSLDMEGKLETPLNFKWVKGKPFQGRIILYMNGKNAFLDRSGQIISPFLEDFWGIFTHGYSSAKLNEKYGLLDTTGTWVIPAQYDNIETPAPNIIPVQINQKWGFIDYDNNIRIAPIYDELICDDWSEGLGRVRIGRKWGYIDTSGTLVIPPNFNEARRFNEGRAVVSIKKYAVKKLFGNRIRRVFSTLVDGVIDEKGRWVIKPDFYAINNYQNGVVRANSRINKDVKIKKYYWFDWAGNQLFAEEDWSPEARRFGVEQGWIRRILIDAQ